MSGQKVWASILSGVKSQVSASTFKTWFAGSNALDIKQKGDGNLLIVSLRNNFLKEQVEARYLPTIYRAAKKKGFAKTEIVFVVSASEVAPSRTKKEPLFSGIAPTYLVGSYRKTDSLNLTHTFENFVVGPSNNLAVLAFGQVANNLGGGYNPLFVYGATGVGKTHLLQALGNEVLNKIVDVKLLYVTCEKFTNDYVESLKNRTIAAFRQKYRSVDLILVDDVQFLAGKESTQEEFFHTFNELYLSGKQVVLACDRHPKDLSKLQERLVSRFLGGMTVDIGKPDLELRMAILRAKCQEKGVELGDEVIAYIAQACSEGVRELEGLLVQVLSLTKLTSGKISLERIKETLERNKPSAKTSLTAEQITRAVSGYFKIAKEDLCGPQRRARLVGARQVLMFLLRQELGLPLAEIGNFVGGRDHSTVLYSIDKVRSVVAKDQSRRDEIARIRLGFQQTLESFPQRTVDY